MPTDVIRNYLALDVTDTTDVAIYNANPGVFASSGDVPVYLYKSLKTLLGVGSMTVPVGTTDTVARRIIAREGEGATIAEPSVILRPFYSESVDHPSGMDIDIPGAEYTDILFLFRNFRPVPPESFNTLRNVELRIRLLIDQNLRGAAGYPPDLPVVTPDFCVDQDNHTIFKCFWRKFELKSTDNTSEFMVHYCVEYVRVFAKVPGLPT